jgi:uncharacterized membrane protein YccF (DUF307 family)
MKSRIQESENRIQNPEARRQKKRKSVKVVSTLSFWLLLFGFWILLFRYSSVF